VALLFAALSLTLCVTGVYGVVAYGVAARFREFGVRLTLGAGPGRVAGEVVLGSLGPTILGLVTGALASVALTRVAARFLFGIGTGDWLPAVAAAGLVLALALLATWLPARRAGRVDPATVLSAE
jgi:ABC-type antimicrobial peptide transport system permease subunit